MAKEDLWRAIIKLAKHTGLDVATLVGGDHRCMGARWPSATCLAKVLNMADFTISEFAQLATGKEMRK